MAIADYIIAVWKHFKSRHPSQCDIGQVILCDFPDDLLAGRNFDDAMSVAGGNQCVSVFEPHGGERLISERVWAVAWLTIISEQRYIKLPDNLSVLPIVLTNYAVRLVAYQIVTVSQFAGKPCVGVRVRV